jgi:hypothetical protein
LHICVNIVIAVKYRSNELAIFSVAELVVRLGLVIAVRRSHYNLITIGGGPAGLTAACEHLETV